MHYLKLLVRKLGEDVAIVVPCIGLGSVDCGLYQLRHFCFQRTWNCSLRTDGKRPPTQGSLLCDSGGLFSFWGVVDGLYPVVVLSNSVIRSEKRYSDQLSLINSPRRFQSDPSVVSESVGSKAGQRFRGPASSCVRPYLSVQCA